MPYLAKSPSSWATAKGAQSFTGRKPTCSGCRRLTTLNVGFPARFNRFLLSVLIIMLDAKHSERQPPRPSTKER
jgi:hypothetical protein